MSTLASKKDEARPNPMVKQLYEKIEDLKIIEDIVSKSQPVSTQAQIVIRQLQQEIVVLSQDVISAYREKVS